MKTLLVWMALLAALGEVGCTTRIPYQGDLVSLEQAMNQRFSVPVRTVAEPRTLKEAIESPNPGLPEYPRSFIVSSDIIWLHPYMLWPEPGHANYLTYAIKQDHSGIISNCGRVSIRVDGKDAIVGGGNDVVIEYIRLAVARAKPTSTPADPVTP